MWLIYFQLVKVRHLAGSHKSFGFFPPETLHFRATKWAWMCFWVKWCVRWSSLLHKTHCAAKPDAACCDARCSALQRPAQRTASNAPCAVRKSQRLVSSWLLSDFVSASYGLGRSAKGAVCRLLVVCEAGVCVVRGQKASSGKAVVTAFLPACCFILSGLHACAPGVSAGL